MKTPLLRHCTLAALAIAFCVATAPQAQARPNYKKAFDKTYEVNTKTSCNTCHGKSKKNLSEYGIAIKEALGEKNVKDQDKIVEALHAVEDKGDVDGKTYGEIIKSGELPPGYVPE